MGLRGNIWIVALCAWFLLLTSCETIPEGERLIEIPLPEDTTGGAHLLIEYTGFRCVNCPKASEAAQALKEMYGERLLVVSMHPESNPFTQGKYDYTCEAADIYYRYMGGTATTPFPTGNIDLAQTNGNWFSDYSEWPTLLARRMSEPAKVHMTEENGEITFFADKEQTGRLVVWLVEDSVQGAQALPDGSVDLQYYHRHMLRGAIGNPWGEEITIGLLPTKYAVSWSVPEGCDPKQCRAVVIILNENKELLNAIEMKE